MGGKTVEWNSISRVFVLNRHEYSTAVLFCACKSIIRAYKLKYSCSFVRQLMCFVLS